MQPISMGQNFFNLLCPLVAMVTCKQQQHSVARDIARFLKIYYVYVLYRFLVLPHRSVRYLARRGKIARSSIKQEGYTHVTSVGSNTQNTEIPPFLILYTVSV